MTEYNKLYEQFTQALKNRDTKKVGLLINYIDILAKQKNLSFGERKMREALNRFINREKLPNNVLTFNRS